MIKFNRVSVALLPALVLLGDASPVSAGEFSLGIAAGNQSAQYLDQEDSKFLIPVISYQGERFSFFLDTAAWRLAGHETDDSAWRIQLVATARVFEEPEDSAALLARDSTLEAGFEVGLRDRWGSLSLEAVADTLGKHEGYEVTLNYSYDWALTERFTLTPSLGVSYQDENLANYYYGVNPAEVRPGRLAYQPREGGTFTAGLMATYGLTSRWTLVALVNHATLSDELADSPLIDSDSGVTAVIGAMYRF